MIQQQTVNVILQWIEENLEKDIYLEDITVLSGYSRRHIQSLFKNYVDMTIGAYIRQRKLCRAALLLHLTNLSIIDIAIRLNFDSQQSFSREFKKLFGRSPGQYRNSPEWDLTYLRAPHLVNKRDIPKFELCHLQDQFYRGYQFSYEVGFLNDNYPDMSAFRLDGIKDNLNKHQNDIYLVSDFVASQSKSGAICITTNIGIKTDSEQLMPDAKSFHSEAGLYAHFHFEGEWNTYAELSNHIYLEELPARGLKRRAGGDIEHIHYDGTLLTDTKHWITCDYFIPIE